MFNDVEIDADIMVIMVSFLRNRVTIPKFYYYLCSHKIYVQKNGKRSDNTFSFHDIRPDS